MKNKHTPGPWSVAKYDKESPSVAVGTPIATTWADHFVIGRPMDDSLYNLEREEADAHLIAASPLLLESARLSLELLDAIVTTDEPDISFRELKEILNDHGIRSMLRLAVKRAQGQWLEEG